MKDTIKITSWLLLLAGLMVLGIFIIQSWFHPYETNCHLEAIGRVCDVNYHLYWKPTLNI